MLISQLPPNIRLLALNNQEAQGNPRNASTHINFLPSEGGFRWSTSLEGSAFWTDIIRNYVAIEEEEDQIIKKESA